MRSRGIDTLYSAQKKAQGAAIKLKADGCVLQAEQLSKLLKRFKMMAHVNLIPYNPVEGSDYVRPSRNQVVRFSEALTKSGIVNSIRITKGLDAAAACGQLRNEHQKQPLPEFAGLA